jgi:PAB-dependent poly(A)-specific ribonuclease subunit 2
VNVADSLVISLNLLEENSAGSPLTMMIQAVNRFLVDKFVTDFSQMSPQTPYMDQV